VARKRAGIAINLITPVTLVAASVDADVDAA
jgi:hypothetical protein